MFKFNQMLLIALCSMPIHPMMNVPCEVPAQANSMCPDNDLVILKKTSIFDCPQTDGQERLAFEETTIAKAIKAGDLETVKDELANKGWRGWLRWIFAREDAQTARAWRCLRYTLEYKPDNDKDIHEIVQCLCEDLIQRSHSQKGGLVWQLCAAQFYDDYKANGRMDGRMAQQNEFMDYICKYRKKYQECRSFDSGCSGPMEAFAISCDFPMRNELEERCQRLNGEQVVTDLIESDVQDFLLLSRQVYEGIGISWKETPLTNTAIVTELLKAALENNYQKITDLLGKIGLSPKALIILHGYVNEIIRNKSGNGMSVSNESLYKAYGQILNFLKTNIRHNLDF